jgi:hypothetical protein
MLARIAEVQKRWGTAIYFRKKIARIDPYNTLNLLELGEDQKKIGDLVAAKDIVPLIDAIDPGGLDAKKAHIELGG